MSDFASYMVIFKKEEAHAAATDALIDDLANQVTSKGQPLALSPRAPLTPSRCPGGEIAHRYNMKSMRGFSAKLDPDTLKALEAHPAVSYVGPSISYLEFKLSKMTFSVPRLQKQILPSASDLYRIVCTCTLVASQNWISIVKFRKIAALYCSSLDSASSTPLARRSRMLQLILILFWIDPRLEIVLPRLFSPSLCSPENSTIAANADSTSLAVASIWRDLPLARRRSENKQFAVCSLFPCSRFIPISRLHLPFSPLLLHQHACSLPPRPLCPLPHPRRANKLDESSLDLSSFPNLSSILSSVRQATLLRDSLEGHRYRFVFCRRDNRFGIRSSCWTERV